MFQALQTFFTEDASLWSLLAGGFSSTHHGNVMSEVDVRRKLALCVEVADEVWGCA